jgi:aspartokinase
MTQETAFEKRRGVNTIEVRTGYGQANLSEMKAPLAESRVKALDAVAKAGISIDFLKMTQDGISFLVKNQDIQKLRSTLETLAVSHAISESQSVVLIHAVSIRDEEGLVARILQIAIASGARVHHTSDMHDKVLLVVDSARAETLRKLLLTNFPEAGDAD